MIINNIDSFVVFIAVSLPRLSDALFNGPARLLWIRG
jgi:hypothetical protein